MDIQLKTKQRKMSCKAFTLVELLVVISIIAMLLAVLMPALSKARESAKAVICAANMRGAGLGMQVYVANYRDFRAAYLYASTSEGGYSIYNQDPSHPYGYL